MTKTVKWTTGTDQKAEVAIKLITDKKVSLDGDVVTIKDCRIDTTATIDGREIDGWLRETSHPVAVARIGNLGINQENYDRIQDAIAEIKQAPEWIAHEEALATAEAGRDAYDKHAASVDRMMTLGGSTY